MQLQTSFLACLMADNWGTGYSDTPPNVRHDARLFQSHVLFAFTSSPISWTGSTSAGFSLIGFSLGGATAMSFAAHYYYLINSIVLLAPGGILPYVPKDYANPLIHVLGLVPFQCLRRLVAQTVGVDMTNAIRGYTKTDSRVSQQVKVQDSAKTSSGFDDRPLDMPAVVKWQFDYHNGFVHSFLDTIRYGPSMHEHSDWQNFCEIVSGKDSTVDPSCPLFNSKILVIFGQDDEVVVANHVGNDIKKMLGGPEYFESHLVLGGHGFPVVSSHEVLKHILHFWNVEALPLEIPPDIFYTTTNRVSMIT